MDSGLPCEIKNFYGDMYSKDINILHFVQNYFYNFTGNKQLAPIQHDPY